MRPTSLCHAVVLVALIGFTLGGCDQQQPIVQKTAPDPGFKPGETPPVEPDKTPAQTGNGNAPVPPTTAPTSR